MIETLEQRRQAVNTAGEDLVFTAFTLKGIPGMNVYNVQNFDSPFDIDKQDFSFQVLQEDFIDNAIASGNTFTYALFGKTFTFSILPSYFFDLTGWVMLNVKLTGVS